MSLLEIIQNNASAVSALLAVIITATLNHLYQMDREIRKEKKERKLTIENEIKRNKELVEKSFNKVLSSSYQITGLRGYNPSIKSAEYTFDFELFSKYVRPALYENFDLLSLEMRMKIFELDRVIEAVQYGDYATSEEYTNDIVSVMNELLCMIKEHYGHHNELVQV
ncbi:hypothetical protein L2089_15275 [Paenibacillus hunanensis]|uniref:hypothetical protein n=1 Tax=Paenibacillus hunanensis TaxID=539262 RepID=UPI002025EE22|nr:hypothetical protein [Paenibacillus hunanensis]MCL9662054.1 hypothetical protein [Paenibacillus hunanensis]